MNIFGKVFNTKIKEIPETAPVPEEKRNIIFDDLVESLNVYVNKNKDYKQTKQGKENPDIEKISVETYNIINKKGVVVYCHINNPPKNITMFKVILDFNNNIAECTYLNEKLKKYFLFDHKYNEISQRYLKYVTKNLKKIQKFNPHYERNIMPEPIFA